MRLVTSRLSDPLSARSGSPRTHAAAGLVVLATLCGIFALDRATGAAPVQHLYYLPIIVAALQFHRRGAVVVSTLAIVLYHLANKRAVNGHYGESDIIQIVLFFAVGVITAQFFENASRLRVLAMTDDLTGLHNLRSFEARLLGMMYASHQANRPLSLLVLDVDRLKSLNDSRGHLCGAEAVRTVGHIISEHIPPTAVACRYGGDEFAIALPDLSAQGTFEIAEKIREAVQATAPVLAGHSLPAGTLSVSIGIAIWAVAHSRLWVASDKCVTPGREERESEALFRAADRALYAAKAAGRNRVHAA
jgi:diguanylate cyclase (GGDEF)-like protein